MCFLKIIIILDTSRASLIAVEYEKPMNTNQDIVDADQDLFYPAGSALIEGLQYSPNAAQRGLYELVSSRKTFFPYKGNLPRKQLDQIVYEGTGVIMTIRYEQSKHSNNKNRTVPAQLRPCIEIGKKHPHT